MLLRSLAFHKVPVVRYSTSRFLTVNIIAVGKPSSVDPWLAQGYEEYNRRLRGVLQSQWCKDDATLVKRMSVLKDKSSYWLLDERGALLTSEKVRS